MSRGPYYAAELAYRIHTGLLDGRDEVLDSRTGRRYVVGQQAFLSTWLSGSRENELRLLRGLLLCARKSARNGQLPDAATLPSWMPEIMTDAERKAFQVLSLKPSSSAQEVRKRHRELVVSHHPDRGGHEDRMKEINWAYEVVQKVVGF